MNLTLGAGNFTAVVGTSGGGKSTLLSLLLRIYDYSGHIWVGCRELREMDPSQVRSQIVVLEQDYTLFSGSILDNVSHGLQGQQLSESARVSLCQKAITEAGVDFLENLPNGVHTLIDNTFQLSGGQCQRIFLAQALTKRPAILILDEPTSALDGQSELKVMQAVRKIAACSTTVVLITHRLSKVLEADLVCVMNDGQVVEQGAPFQLAHQNTLFHKMLDAQSTNMNVQDPDPILTRKSKCSGRKDATAPKEQNDTGHIDHIDSCDQLTFRQLVTSFLRFAHPERFAILGGVPASVISGAIILGEAIILGNLVQLLNSEVQTDGFKTQANFYCVMFFTLACVAMVSYVCSGTAFGIASMRLASRLQAAILENVLRLDLEWFAVPGRSAHALTSRFAKDSGDLASLPGVALGFMLSVVTSVCEEIILAHVMAWRIAVVLLAAVPVSKYTIE